MPLNETSQGVAFSVNFVPEGSCRSAAVPKRLESPRKVIRSPRDENMTPPRTPTKEEVAMRARTRNAKRSAAVAQLQQNLRDLQMSKRSAIDAAVSQAAENRSAMLADKKAKAGSHFEKVIEKGQTSQRQRQEALDSQQKKLQEAMDLISEKREACLAKICDKASSHIQDVKAKVAEIQRRKELESSEQRRKLEETMTSSSERRDTGLSDKVSKAQKQFEAAMSKAADLQQQDKVSVAEKQRLLEEALNTSNEKRAALLSDKSTRAGGHFTDVMEKGQEALKNKAEEAARQQKALEEKLDQKTACQSASMTERRSKAGQHNEAVATKVKEHMQEMQEKTEKLRERLEEKSQRQPARKMHSPKKPTAPALGEEKSEEVDASSEEQSGKGGFGCVIS